MSNEVTSEQGTFKPEVNIDVAKEREKPRLLSLLFCDFSNVTSDNKANLLGIFDRVYVHPDVKQTPFFMLFVRLAEAVKEPLHVIVYDPDGSPLTGINFGGQATEFTPDLPAQLQLVVGLQFTAFKEGVYWFNVFYKDESLGGAGLVVQHRPTEGKEHGTDTYV